MSQMKFKQYLKIIITYYTLENVIIILKKNKLLLARDSNVNVSLNVQLYDSNNQFAMYIRMK